MKGQHSARWPYRQADPKWANDTMSLKNKLIGVHLAVNGKTLADVRDWEWGDTIGTDGCLLTCLAMTLRLLATDGARWTPRTLNREARKLLYYSDAGLSIVPLYADLLADVSDGSVQLCVQEQYFAGEKGHPARFASQSSLIRGYRTLSPAKRLDFTVMVKIGTHDDTFASHYVLVDPDQPGSPNEDDFAILDPDQPKRKRVKSWFVSDSYRRLHDERQDIRTEWHKQGIRWQENQLCAVWAFARWRKRGSRCLAGDLFKAVTDC